jgi:hypothetical protein
MIIDKLASEPGNYNMLALVYTKFWYIYVSFCLDQVSISICRSQHIMLV